MACRLKQLPPLVYVTWSWMGLSWLRTRYVRRPMPSIFTLSSSVMHGLQYVNGWQSQHILTEAERITIERLCYRLGYMDQGWVYHYVNISMRLRQRECVPGICTALVSYWLRCSCAFYTRTGATRIQVVEVWDCGLPWWLYAIADREKYKENV